MSKNFPFYKNECNFESIIGNDGDETIFFTIQLSKRAFYKQDARTRFRSPFEVPRVCRANVQLLYTGIKIPKNKVGFPLDAKFAIDIGQIMLVEEITYKNDEDEEDGMVDFECIFAPAVTPSTSSTSS